MDAVLYFAWGETKGYAADEIGTAKGFAWKDYNFGNALTKYNSTDDITILENENDVAYKKFLKDGYHIPTKEQFQELLDNTTYEWTTANGVKGGLFTSKNNGKSIFIPADGYCYNGTVLNIGEYGVLWSSSLNEDDNFCAWYLGFDDSAYCLGHGLERCNGLSIRGCI